MMAGFADIARHAGWLCWLFCVDVLAMRAGYIDYLCWWTRLVGMAGFSSRLFWHDDMFADMAMLACYTGYVCSLCFMLFLAEYAGWFF